MNRMETAENRRTEKEKTGQMAMGQEARLAKLRVNSVEAPLAVDEANPVFSWQMVSGRTGARQEAYQIRVYQLPAMAGENCCWDSGRVESSQSVGICYPKEAARLEAERNYRWELTVWDETGSKLEAGSTFATGLMGEGLPAWHGAAWIGSDEIAFAAETLPVFRIQFQMQIAPGGSSAGVVFGANDPRLSSSTKNNYLICGENYIAYQLNVSHIPAVVEVYRKGYAPGEAGTEPVAVMEVPENVLNEGNRYEGHTFEIVVSGNQMEVMTVDGCPLETDEENARIVSSPMRPVVEKTRLVLNPLKAVMDMPIFPRLCEVGFVTAEDTEAIFTGYAVRHYGGEKNEIFGERTGASYAVFAGKPGLSVEGSQICVAPGALVYTDPSYGSVPMLHKDFSAGEGLACARLYATARGIYEMTLNGQKVGEDYLAPGDMDFRQRALYMAYDVTNLVKEGENAIGAMLASGWYGDQTSYTIENYNYYGDRQALLAVLALVYQDGTVEYVPTDASWQYYGQGPVRYAGNFNGETYDATREAAIKGFDAPGFDASGWKAATVMEATVCGLEPKITAKTDPGITVVEVREATFVSKETRGEDQDTVYIYDMGVNMVGVPEITFPAGTGRAGQKITIRYAEILYPELEPDNEFYYGELGGMILTENLRGALVTDHYVRKGEGEEVFSPRFTFHGYRYVELSGIDEALPAEQIKGIVLSSVRQASFYESSNPLTNRLFANIIRSTIGNHLSIPTDCPQRDERLGWAGDANVFAETATYMADMGAFYRNFSLLQMDAQGKDGTYHLYAPSYSEVGNAFALGYTWNAAGVMIPYETWLQYGNLSLLKENYPNMKRHVEGMMQKKAEGREYLTSHIGFLGDHLAVVGTDASLMDNAQFYRVICRVQSAAKRLGELEDATAFAAYADGLKQEWNEVFINEAHQTKAADGVLQDTQASYALPLMCGIFTEENEPYACRYLSEACQKTGYTMTTGFMGTGPLLPALTLGDDLAGAYKMFEQTVYPSWLYPVINGATSIWERWNSYTIENGFSGQNRMNSFNHYSLGAVGSWMMEYQAGIQRGEEAGFQRFILQPMPGGSFTYVKAAYDSVLGRIESGWTVGNGVIAAYDAVVPANTTAVLYLPVTEEAARAVPAIKGASYQGMEKRYGLTVAVWELTSGSYHFDLSGK